MIINKITVGYVVQQFDTEKNEFISQEFVAGDSVDFEKPDGTPTDSIDNYLSFDMVQPK